MFRRPTCMQACLNNNYDYDYCRIWCKPNSSQQYQTYAYGQQTDPRWECYY
ncbi:uncharacterized protein KNN_06461 (plasmid) [Bacillus thuringiensis serovar tolworthi]|uniref:Uncharacterized protein n=1 Tax=Bacillus thuringiensis subsp. tolworthi TaxID=1442 RepID=A0A9W4AHR1_BACTO|nr:uncharacterized protein KNN_06461 [Bacillus thuringiensis serovar tolworthi]